MNLSNALESQEFRRKNHEHKDGSTALRARDIIVCPVGHPGCTDGRVSQSVGLLEDNLFLYSRGRLKPETVPRNSVIGCA